MPSKGIVNLFEVLRFLDGFASLGVREVSYKSVVLCIFCFIPKKIQKDTALSVPRRSPIQVLSEPAVV